jgi:hypothetical protein
MATNPVDNFWGSSNQDSGSVPPVEPADLRSVWEMQSGVQALHPGQQIMIGAETYKQACGAEADVRAVYERVSHLWMLKRLECSRLGCGMVFRTMPCFTSRPESQ